MKRRILCSVTALLIVLSGCYTNPVTGRKSLVLLSQGQELSLGQASFAEIQKTEKVSRDGAAHERVGRVGRRIAEAVGDALPDAKWEFVVFESDDVNAFALPGGKVGVYSGLLQLAGSDDELAAVMGHEIGHVIARHGAERMSEALVLSGLGELGGAVFEAKTGPEKRQVFDLAYGVAATVGRVLPHSRGNELEADRMGVLYAARAGYDPRAAITFWEKMVRHKNAGGDAASSGALAAILSTHPPDQRRIAGLHALMPSVLPIYEQSRDRQRQPD
jgi:metalloendopeptidase OMA1, mitochondrial